MATSPKYVVYTKSLYDRGLEWWSYCNTRRDALREAKQYADTNNYHVIVYERILELLP